MAKVIDAIIQLRDNFTAKMEQVNNSITKFQKQAQRLGREIVKQGETIQNFGETMSKAITLPVVGALTVATKLSLDYSDAIAKVGTIADTTAVPLQKLKEQIIQLSNATGVSVTDLAEAEYQAISAGVNTADSIKFLEAAVKAAKAGFSDMVTVVDGLTSVLNSYGLSAKEAAKISNQMMIAQNLGKTTIDEMARSIGLVAPIASSAGLKTEELFTNLAVLTAQGLKTSEAVTGLKQAIQNVINPSDQAKKTAEALGIQFSASAIKSKGWLNFLLDVRKKLEQAMPQYTQAIDKQAKLKAQIETLQKHSKGHKEELQKLKAEYKNVSAQVKALEDASRGQIEAYATMFGSVEALNAVLALTSEQGVKMYNTSMRQMKTQTDVVDKALRQLQTPGEQLRKALNSLRNSAMQLGDILAPTVAQIAQEIKNLISWFNKLTPAQKQSLVHFMLIAATMGPVIKVLGTVYTGIGKIILAYSNFAKAVKTTGSILGAIFTPANTIFLIIVAIAVAAFLIIKYWKPIKTFFINLWNGIKQAFFSFLNVLKRIGPYILAIVAPVIGIPLLIIKHWQPISKFFVNLWNGIKKQTTSIWSSIVGSFKGFINLIIKGINFLIGSLNKIHFKVPSWVPGFGGKEFGFNIPKIPMLAKGTEYFSGGPAIVGERGPELVYLPRGSKVVDNKKTEKLLSSKKSINVTINVEKMEVRSEADLKKFAEMFVSMLEKEALNYGGAV